MKRKLLLIASLLMLGTGVANAQKASDFSYSLRYTDPVSLTLTYCNSENTKITIPATAYVDGADYKVTAISSGALNGCSKMEKLVIGENINYIESNAFQNCANLKTVDLSNAKSFTYISDYAFANSKISRIEIPSWITSIGNYAFQNCDGLTNIAIPASVTWIGNYAFRYCDNLVTVDLSQAKGLRTINNYAFDECYGLKNIEIPNWITSIGSNAFYDCDALTSITIPESVTSIGSSAFEDCNNLETVDLSNARSLTSIGQYVFYNCDKITEITIPSSVTSIGNYAFYDCDGLKEITIPENVTSIGNDAFSSCDNLAKVDLSNARSLTSIGIYAFYGCDALTKIAIPENVTTIGSYAFQSCSNLATVDMSSAKSLTSIGSGAFYDCDGLKEITIPENVTSIVNHVFYSCDNLAKVDLSNARSLTTIDSYAFYNCDKITEITIPSSVTSIGGGAFYDCDGLKEITIPENVTSIGQYAFYSCDNLAKADLSNAKKLTSIGQYAFSNNKNLKTADLSNAESLTTISDYAFSSCANLEKADLSGAKNLSYASTKAFFNSPKLKSFGSSGGKALYSDDGKTLLCYLATNADTAFTVPSTVTTIANYAFCDCDKLKQVTIPSSVTSIGSYAFYGCDNLAKIDFRKATGLTYFDSYAFNSCPKLTTIDLSATSLTTIGESAFYDNDYLTEITLPESVTSIGEDAFYDCDNLKQLTIPSSVTSIGNYAFYGCGKLAKVDFNKARDLTYIGVNTFNACALTTIDLSATSLTTIGSSAFYDNNYLTEITLPESVILIDSYAFSYCDNLKDVSIPESLTHLASNAFEGSINVKFTEQDGALYLGNQRNPYIVLYKATSTNIAECTISNKTKMIAEYAFSDCSNLTSIKISSSVTAIDNYAFYRCYGMETINVPEGVASIGESAFYGIRNLNYAGPAGGETSTWGARLRNGKMTGYTEGDFVFSNEAKTTLIGYTGSDASITLPESTVTVNSSAFRGCKSLKSVTIPDGVTTINSQAFAYCPNLKTIKIGSGVTSISSDAFSNCPIETLTFNTNAVGTKFQGSSTLKTVNVGDKVTTIGSNAFQNCGNLATVDLSKAKSLTTIGGNAFYNCDALNSITIPEKVTSIGSNAFQYCDNLATVDLSKARGLKTINNYAFYACYGLVKIEIPEWITSIGSYAFYNCDKITEITIPSSVTSIGNYAFYDCDGLKEITIPENVTSIGNYAFYSCDNLAKVDLSNARSLTTIDSYAFYNCDKITEITIPSSVTSIGNYAFQYCSALTTITIPESVTSMGYYAFNNCSSLRPIFCEGYSQPAGWNSSWNPNNYIVVWLYRGIKVNIAANNSVWGSVEGSGTYSYGDEVHISATPAEGIDFLGWSNGETSADFTIIAETDINLTANFCPNQVMVGENTVYSEGRQYYNLEFTPELSGRYKFYSHTNYDTYGYLYDESKSIQLTYDDDAGEGTNFLFSYNLVGGKKYYLGVGFYGTSSKGIIDFTIQRPEFVVTAQAENGTVSGIGAYDYGNLASLNAVPDEHYHFAGWSDGYPYSSRGEYVTGDISLEALFEINSYDITSDASYGTVEGTGSYTYGTEATLTVVPFEGYEFSRWSDGNTDNPRTVTVEDDQYYYALVSAKEYTVNATAQNGTVDGTGAFYYGDVASLHAVPDEGYHFVKWSDGETSSWYHIDVYNNVKLTAEFAINEYDITGSATSGYGTVEGTGTYAHGSTVKLTAKPNKGYEFVEWQNDGSTVNPREFTAVNGGNYVAVMTTKTYTINTVGNNVSVNIWGDTYYGNTIELTASPNYNYNFVEWRDNRGNVISTANPFYYTVTEDAKFTAVVEGVDCTIDATMEHGTVVGTGTYKYGTTATLKAVPEPGYKFVYWENTSTSATRSFKVETTVANYTAYTMPIDYSVVVTTSDAAKGTVSSDAGSPIRYGDVVNISATPTGNYKFVRWSDGNTSASRSITIERDLNLTAVFSDEILYTITATAGPNGAVTGSARYAAGEKATLTAIANVGYHFVKWSDGSTDATHVITVNGDKSLSAEFAVDTYTVSVAAGANGTVTGGGSFEFGAPATITATASAGYHFAGWSDGNTEANRTFNVSGNMNVTAAFEINTYTVNATAKNGKVEGAGIYNHGAEATLTATASTGYHFAQWSDGNSVNPRKVTVTSDVDLKAEFDVNSYEITVAAANGTVTGAGTYNYGSVATLSATAADGYHFTKWADGVLSSSRSVIVTEDKKFTAEFEVDSYNVSAYAQNGSVEGAGYYNHGASATLTAKADEGYHFIQWSDGVKDKSRTETVLSSMSFEAEFEVNTFNITAAEAANGVVSGAGTYNYGAVATLTAVANEGYHFTQWSDGLTSATRRLSVVEDAEFSASFEINTYEVKLSAENGTVSGAGTFEHGEEATISAKAAEHYHFVKWSDGNTQNPRTITVTKNRKLTALFEADLYTITVAAENGTVYGASSSFEFGAVATLTASADFGYHFEKWSDGNTDNPRSVTIDAALLSNIDKPFTAIFEKNPSYVGIEDEAADEVSIYAHGNTIVVENAAEDILVFDAMGRMIAREAVNADRTEIQVEGTGVYVVKTGSTSKRVMIK